MQTGFEGDAIVYCQGAFGTTNGKTAHGLVRRCERYRVACVVDSRWAGHDAGQVLDGRACGIPLVSSLEEGLNLVRPSGERAVFFVVGLAPDGGRLPSDARLAVEAALRAGLNVDSGLHDFLSEDPLFSVLAREHGVAIRDIRKPPERSTLHFFSGKIEEVGCAKVAILGTDSAVGKRTTAWVLVERLRDAGLKSELIGTGQTAWLQGARYGVIMDSLVNDFVAGEIEHAVFEAWKNESPDVLVLEGQGSLMNPAYPGGHELLAAGRPDCVIVQHAWTRKEYDGFPGYPVHPLELQIRAIELLSGKPVVAVTLNHEGLDDSQIAGVCASIEAETGLPCVDVLVQGAERLAEAILPFVKER